MTQTVAILTASILDALNIKEIYYIDDDFEVAEGPEELFPHLNLEGLDEVKSQKFIELFPEGFDFDAPEEVVQGNFAELWSEKDAKDRQYLKNRVFQLKKIKQQTNHVRKFFYDAADLRKYTLQCIGPNQWLNIRDEVFDRITEENKILCLFDQNLSRAEGFTSDGSRSGIALLRDFVQAEDGPRKGTICAIISGEIEMNAEIAFWENWASEYDIERSKFLALSKDRLGFRDGGASFAKGIQLTSINYLFDDIKTETVKSIEASSTKSLKELKEISLFDFEHIVLKKSNEEGLWEVETLLRLYEILQIDNVKQKFIDDNFSDKFNNTISKANLLRGLAKSNAQDIQLTDTRFKLRNQELYLKGEILNKLHIPLQTGDIFRLTKDDGKIADYVLVAQPCDIMIRESGSRKAKAATLLTIEHLTKEKYKEEMKNYSVVNKSFPLHYYDENSDGVGLVDLTKSYTVNIDMLDLAVYNKQGHCQINLSESSNPPNLHLSLLNRYKEIASKFKGYENKIKASVNALSGLPDGDIKHQLIKGVMPFISFENFETPPVPYENGVFDFRLTRIKHYRLPNAAYLLSRYTRFISRDAENNDFAAPVE